MQELSNLNCIEECKDWMSKKELAEFCKCSLRVLEQIVADLSCEVNLAIQTHIKKGGYHNSEVFYDGYLVKLIRSKLLNNQANQGKTSDTIKEIVKAAVKNEDYIYSAKEIWELCNTSKSSWDRFVAGFLSKVIFTQKKDYLEEHPSRSGGNRYTEKTLKTFQAWLMRNQANQGRASDTIKEIVKAAVKNELTKTLSKDEIKLELARNKTLQIQSQAQIEHEKAQKQIITEQERTKREQEKTKRKETELELIKEKKEFARQQSIKKALKIKNFTEPLKQELKIMSKELAQAAVQAEYTKKLKQLDADGKYMLYIFHNPTNPTIYKIGKSNSLGNRLAIGTSENPNLTILYKKWCNCQMACDELEETIHQELREYNYNNYSDTGSKEWFVLTKEKLNEIVNKYNFIQSSY